jgi:hypothetical protein
MGSDRPAAAFAAAGGIPQPYAVQVAPSIEHAAAQLRSMDWEEAQAWCNFVLHRPTRLPAGTEIARCTMRPEAPPGRPAQQEQAGRSPWTISNRAAHRCEIIGAGRALRMKQFLYDWAPPACDHPSLWMSEGLQPAAVDNDILWFGTNYLKRPGASLHRHRTMIEFSVTAGSFAMEEVRDLAISLQPVNEPTFAVIQSASLAQLSYQSRHASDVIAVPVGFWAHKRTPPTLKELALPGEAVPADLMGRHIVPGDRYRLDSAFLLGGEQSREAEFVYDLAGEPGHYVRVLVWPTGSPGSPRLPPERDRHPGATELMTVAGHPVYHAYAVPEFGPHEAVLANAGLTLMVLAKPGPWTDEAWFRQIIGRMLDALQ